MCFVCSYNITTTHSMLAEVDHYRQVPTAAPVVQLDCAAVGFWEHAGARLVGEWQSAVGYAAHSLLLEPIQPLHICPAHPPDPLKTLQHHWRCERCGNMVKRAMNRPPQEADCRRGWGGREGVQISNAWHTLTHFQRLHPRFLEGASLVCAHHPTPLPLTAGAAWAAAPTVVILSAASTCTSSTAGATGLRSRSQRGMVRRSGGQVRLVPLWRAAWAVGG